MYRTIRLKRGKEESLKRFHPWVFSGAIESADCFVGWKDLYIRNLIILFNDYRTIFRLDGNEIIRKFYNYSFNGF